MLTLLLYQKEVIQVATISDNWQIGKYFKVSEVMCKCGCGCVAYDLELMEKLNALRAKIGKPIIINSGYRCIKHNKAVNGSPTSQHLEGKAADIRVTGLTPSQLAAKAEAIGFDGIGIYSSFVHVDTRGYKMRWNE